MREPFILSLPPDENRLIRLPDEEVAHLIKVLRFSVGDKFIAFDGNGNGWHAEVISLGKKSITVRAISELPEMPNAGSISIAVGSVKGPRMDWAVEKAAELGAAKFLPLKTRYAVVEPGEGRARRWKNIALAAAKQSRRLTLMEISPPMSIADIPFQEYDHILVFDIDEANGNGKQPSDIPSTASSPLLIIGPEGGFSSDEREFFKSIGSKFISLGAHPLRTETAVAAALTAVKIQTGLR